MAFAVPPETLTMKCGLIPITGSPVKKTKTYELISEGLIDAVKIGRRTFLVVESVMRYIDSLPRGLDPEPPGPGRSRKAKRRALLGPRHDDEASHWKVSPLKASTSDSDPAESATKSE